jgi:hypothetical protein
MFPVEELHRLSKQTRYRVPSQVENDRAQESTEPVSYSAPEHGWIPAERVRFACCCVAFSLQALFARSEALQYGLRTHRGTRLGTHQHANI